MATAQFARACAITGLVFPKKPASDSSITFSLRKRKGWGWGLGSCVRSSNHTAARSLPKMLRAAVRGSTLLFQHGPQPCDDPAKSYVIRCTDFRQYELGHCHLVGRRR